MCVIFIENKTLDWRLVLASQQHMVLHRSVVIMIMLTAESLE